MTTAAAFKQWCRQSKKRCVLVELDYMYQVGTGDSAVPTVGTLYLSNVGYVDESTTPPTVYDDCLLAVPTYERALDTQTLRGAAQITISGGVTINNADGRYDFLLALAIDGSECRVHVGDASWARSDFVHLFTALNAKAASSKQPQIEVSLADIGLLLNKSIGGTVAVGGSGPNAEKFRPLSFGYVHNAEPILVETSPAYKYAYDDRGTNCSVPVVRSNGAELTGGGTDYTDNADGTFDLTGDPQGDQITCDTLRTTGTSTNYRISDALSFFIGGEAGLTAAGRYAGAHPTYYDSGVTDKPLNDYHCGIPLADKTNVVSLLEDMMSTANGFWAPTRLGEFQYGRMRPEALSAIIGLSGGRLSVAAEIGYDDILKDSIALDHRLPTYSTYQSIANANQTKQTTFAGTLTADERAMLSRDGLVSAAFRGEDAGSPPWTAYLGSNVSYQGGAPELYHLSTSASPLIPTLISGASDTDVPDPATGTSIPDQQAAFNAVRRAQFLPNTEFVGFTTFLEFYDLELGDIVNLTYPRWGLDNGALHQVYRISIDAMRARVELGVTRRRFADTNKSPHGCFFLTLLQGGYLLQENGGRIERIGDGVCVDGLTVPITPPSGGVTWNPADSNANVFLSNGNLSATAAISSLGGTRATVAHSTGKHYFEVVVVSVDAGNNCPFIGIQLGTAGLTSDETGTAIGRGWAQQGSDAYVWDNGTFAGPYSAIANGDVIAFAVDFDAGKAWVAKNNVWRTGDPSAGTSPLWSDITGTLYPAAFVSPSSSVTAHFATSSFTYTPPTGFSEW